MHAIAAVDVQRSGSGVEHRGARGAPARRMAGAILLALVGFDLGDAGAYAMGLDFPSDQAGRRLVRRQPQQRAGRVRLPVWGWMGTR